MTLYGYIILSQIAIFPFLLAIFKSKYSNEINNLNKYFIVSYIVECMSALLIKVKFSMKNNFKNLDMKKPQKEL